ncbi:TetR/AcrR family transcriptional regulator [Ekhidna sp.]|uniref:TetR/AcrR family transcriptional regulator n=1 Tax=Ekhidna sp. TaxID=2608089 RepID=UPI0035160426
MNGVLLFLAPNTQKLLDNRERILASAYAHFSTKGYHGTTIKDIASSLKMSKKTIYFQFRHKEDLFVEVGKMKLASFVTLSEQIIYSDRSFVLKLIDYLEMMHEHVRHLSLKVLHDVFNDNGKLSKIVYDHVNSAVFDRFSLLLKQGYDEKMIDDRVDPVVSLLMYKETLISFLFGKTADHSAKMEKEFHVFLCKQLRSFFRGLLSREGTAQFDEHFDKLPHLTKVYG